MKIHVVVLTLVSAILLSSGSALPQNAQADLSCKHETNVNLKFKQTYQSQLIVDNDKEYQTKRDLAVTESFEEWAVAAKDDGQLTLYARTYTEAASVQKENGATTWEGKQTYLGEIVQFQLKNRTVLVKCDSFLAEKDRMFLSREIQWHQMLPNKAVSVGDTWELPAWTIDSLFDLESQKIKVNTSSLTGSLEGVKDDVATVKLTGDMAGAVADDESLAVSAQFAATILFDLKTKRISSVQWSADYSLKSAQGVTPPVSYQLTLSGTRALQ